MWKALFALIKKDFKLMLSSKFLLLAVGSLVLYSCYINFIYVKIDQDIFPIYLCDPKQTLDPVPPAVISVGSRLELREACADGYAVGIDVTGGEPEIYLVSPDSTSPAELVGTNDKEMKNRREITAEFLFFELAAVGFLGLASMLFKEKQMGVIRVHGILPMEKSAFLLSKLGLILITDLLFAALLTLVNVDVIPGIAVLPAVLVQAGILSLIMALVGFFCAILLPDFKQFSLLYLILAVFVTTPVFLAGQTGVMWDWINYHPMYHLFMAMKNAYFHAPIEGGVYYFSCVAVIAVLFLLARKGLAREMTKEG